MKKTVSKKDIIYFAIVIICTLYVCVLSSSVTVITSMNFNVTIVLAALSVALVSGRIIYLLESQKNIGPILHIKLLNAILPLLYFCCLTSFNYFDFGLEKSMGIIYLIFGENRLLSSCLVIFFATMLWCALILRTYLIGHTSSNLNSFNKVDTFTNKLYFSTIILMIVYFVILISINIIGIAASFPNEKQTDLYLFLIVPTLLYWFPVTVKYVIKKIVDSLNNF